jgi:uncharacterized protein YbjQ (UPF0145 family)
MKKIAWFLLISFLPACVGPRVVEHYVPLASGHCVNRPQTMYVFFEGEQVDFKYKRVGQVQIVGNHQTSPADVLNLLQQSAANKCANVIIGVRSGSTYRDISYTESPIEHQSLTMSGLAVQVEEDSIFLQKYGHLANSTFDHTAPYPVRENNESGFITALAVICAGVGLLFLVLGNNRD